MQPFNIPLSSLRVMAIAVSMALAGLMSGCEREKPPAASMERAQAFKEKGDRGSAIIQLKDMLQTNPNNGEARLLLAKLFMETGEPGLADIELEKAASQNVDKVQLALLKAQSQINNGKWDKVLETLTKGDPKLASLPESLTYQGAAYLGLKKPDLAEQHFQAALKQKADHIPAILGLVRIAIEQKNQQLAFARIDDALKKAPKDAAALELKADMLRFIGKPKEAWDFYIKANEIDPGRVAPYLNLVVLALDEKKFDEARKYLGRFQKAAPAAYVGKYLSAFIAYKEGKLDQAYTEVTETLKVAPNHTPAIVLAGSIAFDKGNFSQAEKFFTTALDTVPENMQLRMQLAKTWLRQGQSDKVIAAFLPIIKEHAGNAEMAALMGQAYVLNKDYSNAILAFTHAAKLTPDSPEAITRLGVAKIYGGDLAGGLTDLQAAAKAGKGDGEAATVLAMTFLNRKEYDKASQALDLVEQLQKPNPVTYNIRGSIALARQDTAGARKAFESALKLQPDFLQAAFNLARMDLLDKRFVDGRKYLDTIVQKQPSNAAALQALAEFLMLEPGHQDEAVSWMEKANKVNPSAVGPVMFLTNVALEERNVKKALGIANGGVAAAGDSPEMLDNLAKAQIMAGEKNQAKAAYVKMVQLQPSSATAHFKLAGIQGILGDVSGAIESTKMAIALNPRILEPYIALAELHLRNKQPKETLNIAERLKRGESTRSLGITLDGDVAMYNKQYSEAITAYQKAFSLTSSSQTLVKLHAAKRLAGDKTADSLIEKWLHDHPKDMNIRFYQAEVLMRDKNYTEAAQRYETILKMSANNPLATANLAVAYHEMKDPRAKDLTTQAVKLAPTDPLVMGTVASIQVESGLVKEAIKTYQQALALDRSKLNLRFGLAQALAKDGQKEPARKELREILATEGQFAERDDAVALLKELGK
ncbi:putative PEP-CTERM system TPR-repeat lipoprotein [Chitinivorax tropicus]|uniref:Putative PEP-CTERM system TPR-repeat lipoprotein n=1 Tax=Chitinivorax tropicus TaxID=714531 RepID=A0A840MDD8_9PROT|nr:XrtA/PEP-CTERM system TPR-repeat protein PrsT [Chitinivorax tropicus]MBB5017324.1 putative PEP-CTERM system TPR-repeat lipoprotein [Chitinivorax tropicus]